MILVLKIGMCQKLSDPELGLHPRQVVCRRDERDVPTCVESQIECDAQQWRRTRCVREALHSVSKALAGLRDLFGAQADVVEVEQEVLWAVASEP